VSTVDFHRTIYVHGRRPPRKHCSLSVRNAVQAGEAIELYQVSRSSHGKAVGSPLLRQSGEVAREAAQTRCSHHFCDSEEVQEEERTRSMLCVTEEGHQKVRTGLLEAVSEGLDSR
jgi:hypothetical protein